MRSCGLLLGQQLCVSCVCVRASTRRSLSLVTDAAQPPFCQGLDRVVCNDIDAAAVESIRKNANLNGVDPAKLVPNQGDAMLVMYQSRDKPYDVVDLDPYVRTHRQ